MCGFAGITKLSSFFNIKQSIIDTVLKELHHRGPDDRGVFLDNTKGILLLHSRLSIIDLSINAHQPMQTSDNRYIIVFNGEIYNYKELSLQFKLKERQQNVSSDTAVLLSLYSLLGKDCFCKLNGSFAFAIYDLKKQKIIITRDPFGEKPLYWTKNDNSFIFASELRALKALVPNYKWNINKKSLALFHTIGSIPPPNTIYSEVNALMPGEWFEINNEGQVSSGFYSNINDYFKPSNINTNYHDAVKKTQELLTKAISSRMVSDVPIGMFLSGGHDSSAILALCNTIGNIPQLALCLDFKDEKYSEYSKAKIAAQRYGINIERYTLTESNFKKKLTNFFSEMDQPTTDGYNTYFLSRAANQFGLKVWLSGTGGDELFGGYPSFYRIKHLSVISEFMQLVLFKELIDYLTSVSKNQFKFSRFLHLADKGDQKLRAYQCCRVILPWRNVLKIISPILGNIDLRSIENLDKVYPSLNKQYDSFQVASFFENCIYLRSQLLRDIDNFSLSNSIEVRVPFIEPNLFSYVFSLPRSFKHRKVVSKSLLLDALPHKLPSKLYYQAKSGFTFPLSKWLSRSIKNNFYEAVFDPSNGKYWDLSTLGKMWEGFLQNKVSWHTLWSFYCFSMWLRENC